MGLVMGCLLLGLAIGLSGRLSHRAHSAIGRLNLVCLFVMLTALGAKLGATPGIQERLGQLGLRAVILAVAAIGGGVGLTVALQWILQAVKGRKRTSADLPPMGD
ncbi:MAG: LysO family transporter [Firmicutes bacterium]|nr:LysO family transporter [Bacillota bacterium]